jgi:hypothetical protein
MRIAGMLLTRGAQCACPQQTLDSMTVTLTGVMSLLVCARAAGFVTKIKHPNLTPSTTQATLSQQTRRCRSRCAARA